MPEISFYLLPTLSQQDRYLFACRLIEKAYRSKQFCYVQTDTQQQSQIIDNQLWTFRPGSFIPHQMVNEIEPELNQIILIGTQSAPENWQRIIINLSSNYPENLTKTERILEILDDNEQIKKAGRLRYRQYQQAGLSISTHKM